MKKSSFVQVASVNGQVILAEDCCIPVNERGFLFGHALFETIFLLEGKVVFWSLHYSRLAHGCKKLLIKIPSSKKILQYIYGLIEFFNKNNPGSKCDKMAVRIMLTGGCSWNLAIEKRPSNKQNIILFTKDHPFKTKFKALKLNAQLDLRSAFFLDVKSSNYLANILAFQKARSLGFDDAIFYNKNYQYTETTTAAFVWFDAQQKLKTAVEQDNCLPSTTLWGLEQALKKHHLPIQRTCLTKDKLLECAGCFVISATRGLVPVASIDDHRFDFRAFKNLFAFLNQALKLQQLRCSIHLKRC